MPGPHRIHTVLGHHRWPIASNLKLATNQATANLIKGATTSKAGATLQAQSIF